MYKLLRDGNFTRAAESLNSDPTSHQHSDCRFGETELGGEVFERRGRLSAFNTTLGERFLPYAERMLSVLDDGVQAVENFHAGKDGEIKIAAPTPFIFSFLVDTLAAFRREHPTVDILIRERNKTTIFDMIHDRMITLGLVNAPVFDQAYGAPCPIPRSNSSSRCTNPSIIT